MTPLEIFFERWQAAIPPTVVTYLEAVNARLDLNDAVDPWGAVVLQPETRGDVTLGSNPWVEETGQVAVALIAKSGEGTDLLDEATAWLRATFHGWKADNNNLRFTAVVGPTDPEPQADGEWWRLGFSVPYVWQSRRVEPVP